MTPPYDTIIVGAGAAGCVLANRLTERGDRTVLLLEAGPDYGPDPDAWPAELRDPTAVWLDSHSWGYAQPRTGGEPLNLARARVVGGTTTVNGCAWVRGSAADYDGWAAMGNPGWSFADLLPYFRRAETDPIGGLLHGTDGPVPVSRVSDTELTPVDRGFLEAADRQGIPFLADFNGDPVQRPGAGALPKNIADGVRMNGAFTYLAPARSRPTLTVVPHILVDRILIDAERITGVIAADGREYIGSEVILCAGAYGSPAILLRSGIGPSGQLADLGIPVVADRPGVGEHLLDHPLVSLDLPLPRAIRPACAPPERKFAPVMAKGRSQQTAEEIDYHLLNGQDFDSERDAWFFWVSVSLQFARSRGRVRLTSRDPEATLDIDHGYFSEPADLEALCDGLELAMDLLDTKPLAGMLVPDRAIGPQWRNRDGLRAWVRARAGTTFHPSSTCRMGPAADPLAVVDYAGRVYGLAGLRVADASIFPSGPRANLHCTIVAVAEKLATEIAGDHDS